MAGGVGLNITPCASVIISEPWYNPFVEYQAEQRVHRIGQIQTVVVHRLITEESVETWMEMIKEKKLGEASELSLVDNYEKAAGFTFEDVGMLFAKYVSFE